MIPAILHDAPLSFVTGIFTLIVGVVLFAAHHHWSGVTAIVVSLIGVLTIVRGVILMVAPGLVANFATHMMQGTVRACGSPVASPCCWVSWLSYAGWLAKSV